MFRGVFVFSRGLRVPVPGSGREIEMNKCPLLGSALTTMNGRLRVLAAAKLPVG